MKINFIFIILIFFNTFFIYTSDDHKFRENNDLVVKKIAFVLKNEYNNYQDKTFEEKLVLKLGENAFYESLDLWEKNYKNIDTMVIILHPRLEYMAGKGDENLSRNGAKYFRDQLIELTRLGFKNLDIYQKSVNRYLEKNNLTYNEITIDLIDDALCTLEFYEEKKALYKKEDVIKKEIRKILRSKELRFKLSFYAFAFDFLNKIRKKIIEKDMKKMEEKIKELQ